MNIKEAKEEIKKTVQAYTAKTEAGTCRIPVQRQRPILLIGPPGIGKTAIMEQIARECSLGLVAYTMTHHTRQSAIGLPVLEKKSFQGHEYTVTSYTMSEIIASVYEQIGQSGRTEGILFLDEINCVSETLMPAMLQFLQYKTFGSHRLPEGWVIVAAGNPPAYNRSVREFDTVTLDRVKKMEVVPDLDVWKSYALERGLHPAVLSFLELKPECFYVMEAGRKGFVTGRGWEDLSEMLLTMEDLGLSVEDVLFGQYLQDQETAGEFACYYRIYEKWKERLCPEQILKGNTTACAEELPKLPFDERLCIIWLLLQKLHRETHTYMEQERLSESLQYFVKGLAHSESLEKDCRERLEKRKQALQVRRDCGLLEPGEEERENRFCELVRRGIEQAKLTKDWTVLEQQAALEKQKAAQQQEKLTEAVRSGIAFVRDAFGSGQESVIFLTGLMEHPGTGKLLKERLPEAYADAGQFLNADRKEELLRRQLLNG